MICAPGLSTEPGAGATLEKRAKKLMRSNSGYPRYESGKQKNGSEGTDHQSVEGGDGLDVHESDVSGS